MPELSDHSDSGKEDGEENWDDWTEEDNVLTKCLFCEKQLPSCQETFKHCNNDHQFSIEKICRLYSIDDYGYIKLINYMRKKCPESKIFENLKSPYPWNCDEFLQPVDVNDPLLSFDLLDLEDKECSMENGSGDPITDIAESCLKEVNVKVENAEAKMMLLSEALDKMRTRAQEWMMSNTSTNTVTSAIEDLTECDDDSYIGSYSHFGIHAEMLKDRTRTESYRDAIYKNRHLFEGKVVLDVGCGTGILSMFAAKAGASQVIGVDQSEILYQAMDIVRENKLDHIITLIKGKLEDVTLPVEKVDVIISEWMGYFLLFESMLDTILYARDRWLVDGGIIFPDGCTICLAGSCDQGLRSNHIGYWDDVYGFKMSCMKSWVLKEASVEIVRSDNIITDNVTVKEIPINTCTVSDLDFSTPYQLHGRDDGEITAIIGYFDTYFQRSCQHPVTFSTGPASTPTHWKQTVFLLENPVPIKKGGTIDCHISCKKNPKDPRSLSITMTVAGHKQVYSME